MQAGHYNHQICNCANPDCVANGCKMFRKDQVNITLSTTDDLMKQRIKELQAKTLLMPGEELELNILLSHWWGLNR